MFLFLLCLQEHFESEFTSGDGKPGTVRSEMINACVCDFCVVMNILYSKYLISEWALDLEGLEAL